MYEWNNRVWIQDIDIRIIYHTTRKWRVNYFWLDKLYIQDPEVLQRQKNRAKFRFRALVRAVMANIYWLEESAELYEGDNVQRRVEQVMKGKHKKKQLLTVAVSIFYFYSENLILTIPKNIRSFQSVLYIYEITFLYLWLNIETRNIPHKIIYFCILGQSPFE